ncbi:MAG: aspartate dehydrogenase [Clostridiales bacterium]|nr:aspartate dehydrogenase [Clostridiales bacterium]
MSLFHRKAPAPIPFDPSKEEPVVKKSICTGETTVGFADRATGHFRDVSKVTSLSEIREFCERTETDPVKIRTIY